MDVQIKLLRNNSKMPIKGSALAACYDVYASEIIRVSDDTATVKLGFSATPPQGYKIVLVPRSSLTSTNWLLTNSPAQGDEDYTGEYMLKYRCIPINVKDELTYSAFPYKIGDRVAQMYIEKVHDFRFKIVEDLVFTERGEGGFGSTGA